MSAKQGSKNAVWVLRLDSRAWIERERLADHGLGAIRQAGEHIRRRVRELDFQTRDFIACITGGRVRDGFGIGQLGLDVIDRCAVQQIHAP